MEFEREETPTIMDGKVIRWTMPTGWVNRPEISASRKGVAISGAWPTMSPEVIEKVKAQLDEAVKESLNMLKAQWA
jgi:hypothetical protein